MRWLFAFALAITALVVVILVKPQVISAQSNAPAVWRVEVARGSFTWNAVLRVDEDRVVGLVSSCDSDEAVEIYDGRRDGATIEFKCASPDGERTISFVGAMTGDSLELTWTKQDRGTKRQPTLDAPLFGNGGPTSLTAKRITPTRPPELRAVDRVARMPKVPHVTFSRLLRSREEPDNWLTYSGSLSGLRHSTLEQITPASVGRLETAWVKQTSTNLNIQATPLVVDGTMYSTQDGNDVVARDAVDGHVIWTHEYKTDSRLRAGGGDGRGNRGLAILDSTLFIGTLDAHVLAIDAYTGRRLWDVTLADARDPSCGNQVCYVITHAPLVVKDKVLVGVAGGEGPIRGFLVALDARSGREVWRFNTVPGPGEPGHDSWSGDSWKTGGAGVWMTGAYDPELNLTYWGTGNPYPANGASRQGDNLYSCSVIALDADSGKLRWHYQFTPHDDQDWDAAQVPVLVDVPWQGQARKAMLWANRNGLMYVLDRVTGQFLKGAPFAEVNWMDGFDPTGRPRTLAKPQDRFVMPGTATNWAPPSFSPQTRLLYIPVWERGFQSATRSLLKRPSPGYAAVRAFDPITGKRRWEFRLDDAVFSGGVLSTASGLVFTGVQGDYYSDIASSRAVDGRLYALDARTGGVLWKRTMPYGISSGIITYRASGTQYVVVASRNTLFAFALR